MNKTHYDNEWGLPVLKTAISMTKIKNILKKEKPTYKAVKLTNIRINGQLRGCSGFIENSENKKLIYIDTESILNNGKILIRTAAHDTDYSGGTNRYTTLESFITYSEQLLKD